MVVFPDTSLAPTALEGLDELTQITIQKTTDDQNAEETVELPDFPELPKLRKVVIDKVKSHQNNTWPGSIFSNLPALEVLEIQTALEYGEGTTKGKLGFSADLFKNNKRLKVVIIKRENRSDEDVTIAIPENWFDNNPLLEEIRFEDWTFDIPRGTFTKLHNLTELQLSEQRIAGDHLKHRIVLSKRSPLFMQVEDEEWLRHGYVLVNANED